MEQLVHCWHTISVGWPPSDEYQGCCFCGLKIKEIVAGPEGHGPFFSHYLGGSHRNPRLDEPCADRARSVRRGRVEDAAHTI